MKRFRHLIIPVIAGLMVFCTGCLSFRAHPVGVEASAKHLKSLNYEIIGEAEGISSSFKLFWIIPVTPASSVDDAVDDAIKSKGGDNLIEAVFTRESMVYIIGTVNNIYVKGKVIRYTTK
jgi:hypothetical protein